MIDISVRIKEIRKKLGFNTQKDFAKKIKIPVGTLQTYEQGRVNIPHTFLEILKNEFSVNTNWLLTGDGEIFNNSQTVEKIITGNNNNVNVGGNFNIEKSFNAQKEIELEETALRDIVNKLKNVHDNSLLNYIDDEITALISRIKVKEKYGSSFGG